MASLTDPLFRLLREALTSIVTMQDPSHAVALLDPVVARFTHDGKKVSLFSP